MLVILSLKHKYTYYTKHASVVEADVLGKLKEYHHG